MSQMNQFCCAFNIKHTVACCYTDNVDDVSNVDSVSLVCHSSKKSRCVPDGKSPSRSRFNSLAAGA